MELETLLRGPNGERADLRPDSRALRHSVPNDPTEHLDGTDAEVLVFDAGGAITERLTYPLAAIRLGELEAAGWTATEAYV